jgi:hypothetical protein
MKGWQGDNDPGNGMTMKVSKLTLLAALACGLPASFAAAQQSGTIQDSQVAAVNCTECGDAACDVACDDACDSIGSCGLGLGLLSGLHSALGGDEPFRLFGEHEGLTIAGWTNVGYVTKDNAGRFLGAPANFNDYADVVNLGQAWVYAEKVADGSEGLGLGGRIDYVYGTDAPDTQAFGIPNDHWDNSWDNGDFYGHALPQVYGEAAYGNLSAKVGHFFTIIGNEVVAATGNFFYSRQFTFYNAEPFTHTGALTTYKVSDNLSVWNGWVSGWDSGFEDNGDAYIGGFNASITDDVSFIYTTALGRFGEAKGGRPTAERGEIHSGIVTVKLTEKLSSITQADYLFTNDAFDVGVRNTFGLNQYLIYQLNDKWALGQRAEWFNFSSESGGFDNADLYNYTVGFNYKPTSNLTLRPEVRWVWDKEQTGVNEIGADGLPMASCAIFGMDMVYTF